MKLAEALIARADNQKRIAQVRDRLVACAKVQEGDAPPESPRELLEELERLIDETERLVKRINRTNGITRFEEERTLTDALAERDMLLLRQSALRQVAEAGIVTQSRYSRSEVRFVSTVNIGALQKRADGLAREARQLDARIQEANWTVELFAD